MTARAAWEIAWKPVLMLIVMAYAIVCIPLMLLALPVMLCFGLCKFAWHA